MEAAFRALVQQWHIKPTPLETFRRFVAGYNQGEAPSVSQRGAVWLGRKDIDGVHNATATLLASPQIEAAFSAGVATPPSSTCHAAVDLRIGPAMPPEHRYLVQRAEDIVRGLQRNAGAGSVG